MEGLIDVRPTTVYLLTYCPEKCSANCFFCPQARTSRSRPDLLSRVNWPAFRLEELLDALAKNKERAKRVCVQAVNYPEVIEDILTIVSQIRSKTQVDISVSCQPVDRKALERLRDAGVDRISIPLDAAAPDLFSKVKGKIAEGPYTWTRHMQALREALRVFGAGRVTTHIIAGLGETDLEILKLIQEMVELGVYPALFAFTPIQGTRLENESPPSLSRYRLIQTARLLLVNRLGRFRDMRFDSSGALVDFGVAREKLLSVIESGLPYLTSGCPNCNRPFYNEKPSGPLYNYPRPLTSSEIEESKRILEKYWRD